MQLNRPLLTVTPTLDGDVLAVLARQDASFTTGQLHRLLAAHSEEGIRKVLRRLTKQGIVLSARVGNAFSYRLNRDHLAADHVVGLARLQETLLDRLAERLRSWAVQPFYAAVFGSAATGDMTADSDLDLLLIRPGKADGEPWESQVDELVTDVSRWTGNDLRPLEFSTAEVVDRRAPEPVLRDVARTGITIVGPAEWLAERVRKSD